MVGGTCDPSASFYWWAHQDSNLEPNDYEARTETLQINDIRPGIFPASLRETIDLSRPTGSFFRMYFGAAAIRSRPGERGLSDLLLRHSCAEDRGRINQVRMAVFAAFHFDPVDRARESAVRSHIVIRHR